MSWKQQLLAKIVEPRAAIQHVKSGMRLYVGGGVGVPQQLIAALVADADRLHDVEIVHLLTYGAAPYTSTAYRTSFRVNALFIGGNVRQAIQHGYGDFTPVSLSAAPALFRDGSLPLNVALVSLSPPDEHGFCSFGVDVGATKPAAESAEIVIAEINRQMPRSLGDSFIHVSDIDYAVPVDRPILEARQGTVDRVSRQIGANVAALIPDGATLQTGIGGIPDAVLANLTDHRDLGVHSELFSDGVIDLIEAGVINGRRKTLHPGKVVAGFMLGTRRLYDYVDDNPFFELHAADYVNDPFNIARNNSMVAINSAVEVDLTGQVCADSIGTHLYSGAGGQIDFVRGAAAATGGMSIIALPSTARNGTASRISAMLTAGAGVVTTRSDVDTVVTEYGVAHLRGRTVRERVKRLVAVAHPQFRDELCRQARALAYM